MASKLEYKPVGFGQDPVSKEQNQGLTGTFFIPAYQRGYRWTKIEVRKLLDDLKEGAISRRDEYYSLQPIVVKQRDGGNWELIDGQQRLTTLWLIFNFMQQGGYRRSGAVFDLDYETRRGSRDYLKTLDVEQAKENIDYFHLRKAHEAIKEWFEPDTENEQTWENNVLQIYTYLSTLVRVIWYEVPADEAPIPIFTRLNRGRIPLTDAELLKAVLLSARSIAGRENEIAAQWDGIERDLQREEIWAFVAGHVKPGGDRYATRISLLLDTLAENERPVGEKKRPQFHTFDTLVDKVRADPGEFWKGVVALHARILGWFEDIDHHNKIGFLVFIGVPFGAILGWAKEKTRSAFNGFLDGEIKRRLDVKKDALRDGKDAKDKVLSYGDGGNTKLENLLLLFNVMCSRERFPFKGHVGEHWSLEHIHAQNAQELTRKDQWESWLKLYRGTLKSLPATEECQGYIAEIEDALGKLDSERFGDHFRGLSARIEAHLSPSDRAGEADHTLANLALLSRDDNAALNNAVFEVKRQMVLEWDKGGIYVPLATRHVFLKYYSKAGALQPHFWGPEDKAAYRQAIEEKLALYLS
ncbi:MAG: DUF262 domain-containing protein [Chromatiaceae bacterium]